MYNVYSNGVQFSIGLAQPSKIVNVQETASLTHEVQERKVGVHHPTQILTQDFHSKGLFPRPVQCSSLSFNVWFSTSPFI